ncbi:hypothetical protein JCM10207_003242 [Rhodosporidiobolus poonsookiae]
MPLVSASTPALGSSVEQPSSTATLDNATGSIANPATSTTPDRPVNHFRWWYTRLAENNTPVGRVGGTDGIKPVPNYDGLEVLETGGQLFELWLVSLFPMLLAVGLTTMAYLGATEDEVSGGTAAFHGACLRYTQQLALSAINGVFAALWCVLYAAGWVFCAAAPLSLLAASAFPLTIVYWIYSTRSLSLPFYTSIFSQHPKLTTPLRMVDHLLPVHVLWEFFVFLRPTLAAQYSTYSTVLYAYVAVTSFFDFSLPHYLFGVVADFVDWRNSDWTVTMRVQVPPPASQVVSNKDAAVHELVRQIKEIGEELRACQAELRKRAE